MNIQNARVTPEQVYNTHKRLDICQQLADYYKRMHDERFSFDEKLVPENTVNMYKVLGDYSGNSDISAMADGVVEHINIYNKINNSLYDDKFLKKAESIGNCSTVWEWDTYIQAKEKILKSVNRCHDRFCPICQQVIEASRLRRFKPLIDKIGLQYDLYHITFTVPNVRGFILRETMNKMAAAFKKLIRYFKLEYNVPGLDFEKYHYMGALRSFETTYSFDDYHTHFHCIFAFDGFDCGEGEFINKYSYKLKIGKWEFVRKFTDFEIILQKVWYLIYNDEKVTLHKIEDLAEGYSCNADLITDGQYNEVFKYAIKVMDDKKTKFYMTYENFKDLYRALYKRRCMQGYGVFYNITGEDEIDETANEMMNQHVNDLNSKEIPERQCIHIRKLVVDMRDDGYIYISTKNIQRYLIEMNKNILEEMEDDSG